MEAVSLFKALADPNRVRAFYALLQQELCVCQIVELLQLAPSTVSKHMSILAAAGLVAGNKRGRWVYYRHTAADNPAAAVLLPALQQLVAQETWPEADQHRLDTILAEDPEFLCRRQSNRRQQRNPPS
ncbi:metalloregulator ArsR/SmtB family transcription factor [Acanthopleuribacter pedis]|uniref:Winged helix-turn-helix transcriptional regulator n=1 Tax=Acanthopleuribacter pedis TaxID=442870 RepID=A0A8J7Q032_9BACT|nr:winged helix-turn-helix transcriptional regulator [Acanthopleuribacter pedis]